MSAREQFHGVVAALQPVIHGVPEGALSDPTPCADFAVRDLVGHLLGTSEALRRQGAGEPPDPQDPWGTAGVALTDGWRDQLGDRLTGLADAWAPSEAWEGEAMDGAIARSQLGDMAYVEVLLHGWDLATATGQGVTVDPAAVEVARRVLDEIGELGRSQGAFGPAVEVADDAPAFDHVLGAAGRDPDWTA